MMGMNDVKYTFLLPAYKSQYFEETLNSIKNQVFKGFKVLVSDDCSPEDLWSVYKRIVGDDSRFEYRRNEVNMGGKNLVSHWNLLVDMCDSEFLIMASDDDVYESNFLEEIDSLTIKYPCLDLFRGRVRRINEQGEFIEEDPLLDCLENQISFIYNHYKLNTIHCIANYVFRSNVIKKHKFVDFPLAWFSDDATVFLCSRNGASNSKSYTFRFRDSDCNLSNQYGTAEGNRYKKIIASEKFYSWFNDNILINLYPKNRIEDTQINAIKFFYRKRVFEQIRAYNHLLSYKNSVSVYKWLCNNGFIIDRFVKIQYWWDWINKR